MTNLLVDWKPEAKATFEYRSPAVIGVSSVQEARQDWTQESSLPSWFPMLIHMG
jgi:hypothetical protein